MSIQLLQSVVNLYCDENLLPRYRVVETSKQGDYKIIGAREVKYYNHSSILVGRVSEEREIFLLATYYKLKDGQLVPTVDAPEMKGYFERQVNFNNNLNKYCEHEVQIIT